MKNFKVVLALVPVLLIGMIIYFTGSAFTAGTDLSVNSIKKTSDVCTYSLTVTGPSGCLTGSYTYCVNGGPAVNSSSPIVVNLTAEQMNYICIKSSNGCTGHYYEGPATPCESVIYDSIELTEDDTNCNCQ